jgi:hypothetical protein
MFCDPNILRHDSDSSSKGATSGMGLGRVKTPRGARVREKYSFGRLLREREEHIELRRRGI